MSRWWMRILIGLLGLLAVGWLTQNAASRMYFAERAELMSSINKSKDSVARYKKAQRNRSPLTDELHGFIDRTLGGDLQTVDHKLRTRLNRLAEHVQLQSVSVGTGSSTRKESPAKTVWRESSLRALRDEVDFVELEGWVTGSGTFEQALRLVDSIESEPWLKRIDQVKFNPKDNGGKFDVNVKLTTLFLPGKTPNPATVAAASAAGFDRYMGLVQNSPFRMPPPPPPPPARPEPKPMTDPAPPTGPPPFPYEQWTLTGLAQGPGGAEVWLLNSQTHETRRLAANESLHEATLVSIGIDNAEFRIGEQRFWVTVGRNLNDRAPVNQ